MSMSSPLQLQPSLAPSGDTNPQFAPGVASTPVTAGITVPALATAAEPGQGVPFSGHRVYPDPPTWSPRDLLAIHVAQMRHGTDGRKGPASPFLSVAS